MPYKVIYRKGSDKPYKIVNRETGRVIGSSTSRGKAKASARARMAAHHGWKPTGKKT
jgi:hypothetical protein